MPTVDGDDYTYDRNLDTLVAPYLHRDITRDLRTSDQKIANDFEVMRVAFDRMTVEFARMAVELAQFRRWAERQAGYGDGDGG